MGPRRLQTLTHPQEWTALCLSLLGQHGKTWLPLIPKSSHCCVVVPTSSLMHALKQFSDKESVSDLLCVRIVGRARTAPGMGPWVGTGAARVETRQEKLPLILPVVTPARQSCGG